MAEKLGWVTLSRNFLAFERISQFACPDARDRPLTNKRAAEAFAARIVELEAELDETEAQSEVALEASVRDDPLNDPDFSL